MNAAAATMGKGTKSPWLRRSAVLVVLLALSAVAAFFSRDFRSANRSSQIQSHWTLPQSREVDATVSATGTVKLKTGAEVRVGAQLSGIVEKLNVSIGSRVKAGDVIAEIDSRAVMAGVEQARAQLAHDEVALAKAELDDARMERLKTAQAVATQQVDDARAALQLARATVVSSRRALQAAEVSLNYVTIRAPIGGTIASVSTQQGETVAAAFATPTFVTIIKDDALEVVAMVDEADIGTVRIGEPVTFTTETYPDRDFAGRVVRIAPVATIVSGVVNYEVGIAIMGDKSVLKPDMTANVTIRTASRRALFVPAAAIHQGPGGKFAIVRASGGVQVARRVVTAGRKGDDVEVTRGLSDNQAVLVGDGP